MRVKINENLSRRLKEYRGLPAIILGSVFGALFYTAFSLWGFHFTITGLLLSMLMSVGCFYSVYWGLDKFGDLLSEKLFGTHRTVSKNEQHLAEYQDYIDRLERKGDWVGSAQLRKALLVSGLIPNQASVAFKLALLYEERLQRPADALYWYRKTLSLGDEKNAYRLAAQAGVERLQHSGRISAEDQRLREDTVRQAIDQADYDRAEGLCDEFARLYPKEGVHFFLRGIVASRRNNHPLAASYYHLALALNPDDDRAAFNKAISLTKAEDFLEARHCWTEFLEKFGERDPKYADQARLALDGIERHLQTPLEIITGNQQ